jgi:flavodoxin I
MKKACIFYGSTLGNTEGVAKIIGQKLDIPFYNVADNPANLIIQYECLILGTSTWGEGELQDDWGLFLSKFEKADLKDKTIALFGLGDSASYPNTFVDGMGILYSTIKGKGCKVIGLVPQEGYNFVASKASQSGKFIGLPLDEDNESDLTMARIDKWIELIKPFLQ